MKYNNTFSKDDLRGFILLFCANADFKISQLEFEYIAPRIGPSGFKNLYSEICTSNEYQIINRIQASITKLNLSTEDKEFLFSEIREMVGLDASNRILKLNLFRGLKRILN